MNQKNKIAVVEPVALPAQALAACVTKINELVAAIKGEVASVGAIGVNIGNHAIQLGFALQEATGRQQLDLHLFQGIAGLSDDLSFQMASRCVSLVNRKGATFEFTSFAEVQPELQTLFQGMNLIEAPKRQPSLGAPLETNWGAWIPKVFTPINADMMKLLEVEPMEGWTNQRRETFVEQSRFVHDQHDKAVAMLSASRRGNE